MSVFLVPIPSFHFHGRHSNRAFMLSTTLVELTNGFHVGKATAQFSFLILLVSRIWHKWSLLPDFQASWIPHSPAFPPTSMVTRSQFPLLGPPHLHHLQAGSGLSSQTSISTDSLGNPIASHVFINHVYADDCQIFISNHDLIYEFGSHIQHLTWHHLLDITTCLMNRQTLKMEHMKNQTSVFSCRSASSKLFLSPPSSFR